MMFCCLRFVFFLMLLFTFVNVRAEQPLTSFEVEAALPMAPQILDGFKGIPVEPFVPEKSKKPEWKVPIVKAIKKNPHRRLKGVSTK